MEVTPAEFGRMASVTRQSINGKLRSGTLIINSAGMLDTDNPINRRYLEKHQNQLKTTAAANAFIQTAVPPTTATPDEVIASIQASGEISAADLQTMTLGEIVRRFGNIDGIEKFVKLQKDLVTIEEKNQRLQEKRLQQVPRDFVIARLFGFQQQQASRILDVPESAADQLQAIVLADPESSRQKIIDYLRDLLSRAIGGAKDHIINELTSLRAKYSEDSSESLTEKIESLMEANQ